MPSLALGRPAAYAPSVGAVTWNSDAALQEVLESREGSEYWRSWRVFDQAWTRLQELENLGPNWDSYGAAAPNREARKTAERILTLLSALSVSPTRVVASSEGGVGICFVYEDRYADIECFNTGETVAARYRGMGEPHVWQIAPEEGAIKAAIEQIRAHFSA
jgi:hypothetical protein